MMRLTCLFSPVLIAAVLGLATPANAGFDFQAPTVRFKGNGKLQDGRNRLNVVCRDNIGLDTITFRAPGRRRTLFPGGVRRQLVTIRFRTSKRRASVRVTAFDTSGFRTFAKQILRRR